MIGFERQRQMFAAQFEPHGNGFVYRKHSVGEPIQVSAADRDRYVAGFETFTRQGFWAIVAAAVVLLAALVAYSFTTGTQVPDAVFYIAFGAMFAVYAIGYQRVWNLPARELNGRR
jgi:phosphotransferase system  glucose/maltose/N-acetylglucosamine-specific IIC component